MKLLVAILIVIMVASLAFNAYQWTNNISLTSQSNRETMATLLIHDVSSINSELQKLDDLVSTACRQLSLTGLTGTEAEKVLSNLYTQNSNTILNAATADKNSILLSIQPSNYSSAIGKDVSNQEQNIKMHQTHTTEQILIITGGKGIVATKDLEYNVTPGMVVYVPPGEEHWHGATPDSAFSHLSILGKPHKFKVAETQ